MKLHDFDFANLTEKKACVVVNDDVGLEYLISLVSRNGTFSLGLGSVAIILL